MTTSDTQTKNLYWCSDNVFSGYTSLYFKPDSTMHLRIRYVGVGNWQYTGNGVWYIKNSYLEKVLADFKRNGYRIKIITAEQAAGREKVHSARAESYQEYKRKQQGSQRDEDTRRVREEAERTRARQEEARNKYRQEHQNTYGAFNDFFNDEFHRRTENNHNKRPSSIKSYQEVEDAWLTIFYTLGPDHAKRLYRQAATVLHPDRQGSEESMKVLNTAWGNYNNKRR